MISLSGLHFSPLLFVNSVDLCFYNFMDVPLMLFLSEFIRNDSRDTSYYHPLNRVNILFGSGEPSRISNRFIHAGPTPRGVPVKMEMELCSGSPVNVLSEENLKERIGSC